MVFSFFEKILLIWVLKNLIIDWTWWLRPVILATQEEEIERITVHQYMGVGKHACHPTIWKSK
jgi:hypothetical protein